MKEAVPKSHHGRETNSFVSICEVQALSQNHSLKRPDLLPPPTSEEVETEFKHPQLRSGHLSKLLKCIFSMKFQLASHCLNESSKLWLGLAQVNLEFSSVSVYMSYQLDLHRLLMRVILVNTDGVHPKNPSHLFSSQLSECCFQVACCVRIFFADTYMDGVFGIVSHL